MDPDAPTTTASSANALQLPLAPATSAAATTGLLPTGAPICLVSFRLTFLHRTGTDYAAPLPFTSGLGDYSAYSAAYPYNMAMPTYNQYTTTYNFMGAFAPSLSLRLFPFYGLSLSKS